MRNEQNKEGLVDWCGTGAPMSPKEKASRQAFVKLFIHTVRLINTQGNEEAWRESVVDQLLDLLDARYAEKPPVRKIKPLSDEDPYRGFVPG